MQDRYLNPPTIPLSDLQFEASGPGEDPTARLLVPIVIAGLQMHLEAIAVHEDDGLIVADWDVMENKVGSMQDEADCTFTTTEIDGRSYVIVATPHAK